MSTRSKLPSALAGSAAPEVSSYFDARRADNGFVLSVAGEHRDVQFIAASVDDLIERVRAWATPPVPAKPATARKR